MKAKVDERETNYKIKEAETCIWVLRRVSSL